MAILSQTIAIPIWAAVVSVAATIGLAIVLRGLEPKRQAAVAVGIVALLAAFAGGIVSSQRDAPGPSARQEPAGVEAADAQRRALDARRAELATRASAPGSTLGCLDALAGQSVESDCEQALFASPMSAAVAVSYAAARLQFLADGASFARRVDPTYEGQLVSLRHSVQNDAFGVYAHVLATRDKCTPDRCAAFALVGDASALKLHMRLGLYESYLAKHRERWVTPPLAAVTDRPGLPTSAADAATMALVGSELVLSGTTAVPSPPGRPAPAASTGSNALAAAPAPRETTPPAADSSAGPSETASVPARGIVPPVASVVPNLEFPSASSIPPVSIMAAEPKAAPDKSEPAAPSAAQRPSSPSR